MIRSILLLALLLTSPLAAQQARVRALIVDGQNNHGWQFTTIATKRILEATGRFDVTVSTSPPRRGDAAAWEAWRPDFGACDVVVSNYNGQPWPERVQKGLDAFVSAGGGLVSIHAADNSFPKWDAWNRMIGVGGWGGRNEKSGPYLRLRDGAWVHDTSPGRGGSHGRQRSFVVETRTADHPITKGLPARWLHAQDELYDRLRGPAENVTVLASAFAEKKSGGSGEHEPVLMVISYGKGRVFHTTLGHHGGGQKKPVSLAGVGFATTLARGTEWAATGAVTIPVPEDFPDEKTNRAIEFGRGIGRPNWPRTTSATFDDDASRSGWRFANPLSWRWQKDDGGALDLFEQKSAYKPQHRSPRNIALLASHEVGDFILEARMKQTGRDYGHRDMCVFFGFTDPTHYYYAHIATKTDDHAHNVFIVNGAARKKISHETTAGFDWGSDAWHQLRLVREAATGRIDVYVDDMTKPVMRATDKTFGRGWVGFGSFDDTGRIDDVKLWSPDAKAGAPAFFK